MTGLGPTLVEVTDSPAPAATFEWRDAPDLSLVIVTYGAGRVVDRCLGSIAMSIAADGLNAEVIVVDNPHPVRGHSTGDRIALSTRGVRLMQPSSNLGFGGGNNAGVAVARGGIVGLLNPDLLVAPGQLRELSETARRHPDDVVAPALLNVDGSLQEIGMRIVRNGETRPILEVGTHVPDYASAACWLLTRALFARLGGFDPIFDPAYYEDVDFALRLAQHGGRTVILDEVRVVHEQRSSHTEAGLPDVRRQKQAFMERWPEIIADRPEG